MSDPVTNIEIEDVLSSIRRLVSGEAGKTARGTQALATDPTAGRAAQPGPEGAAQTPMTEAVMAAECAPLGEVSAITSPEVAAADDVPNLDWSKHLPPERLATLEPVDPQDRADHSAATEPQPERLVLTEALRVDAAPQAETGAPAAMGNDAAETTEPATSHTDVAVTDADVDAEHGVISDKAEAALQNALRADDPFVFDGKHRLADYAEDAEVGAGDETGPALAADDTPAGQGSAQEDMATDAAVASQSDVPAFEIAVEPEQDPALAVDDHVEGFDVEDEVSSVDSALANDTAAANEDAVDPLLRARVAALAAAVAGQRSADLEPDGGDESLTPENSSLQWEDHVAEQEPDFVQAEEDARGTGPDPEPAPTNVEPFAPVQFDEDAKDPAASEHDYDDRPAASGEDEAFLDEESLREMISEIVRQELQGALGERITRNVRKLVRREIHRALTSQALE